MVFFRRKKGETGEASPAAAAAGDGEFQPQPEKARKWFEHARSMADRFDYDYALTCYANGIKLDPEAISAHEEMIEAAIKYLNKGGKPASGKEVRNIADGSPVAQFAAAEFAWLKDYRNASLAVKALEAAIKAGQMEFGNWIAPRVLNLLRNQKKVSKNALLHAKDLFSQVSAWDEAITAGEAALQLDPTDNDLAHEIKDLSAQRAMDQGGYEGVAGEKGAFRKFIRDADKQRELIEGEAITTTDSVEERNLERARRAYEENPTIPDVINQYGQQLKRLGTPEALRAAHEVYLKGYKESGEYRFRLLAGDIEIDAKRRQLRKLTEQAQAAPDDEAARQQLQKATAELLELQAREYGERVERYPTDRFRKFDYGQVLYDLGRYEDAMGQFQSAKDEPKLRVRAGHLLGRCFAREDWHPEAIAEFKESLSAIDATEKDRELQIRYDLMGSLIEQARQERSLALAREALEICSGIARRNITFRDIRSKRKEIDALIKELSDQE